MQEKTMFDLPEELFHRTGSRKKKAAKEGAKEGAAGASKGDEPSSEGETEEEDELARDVTFTPVPRETAADKKGNLRTADRVLDRPLYFIVKTGGSWHFPRVRHKVGETIRQSAERALAEHVADSVEVYFIGNAPMGHVDTKKLAQGEQAGQAQQAGRASEKPAEGGAPAIARDTERYKEFFLRAQLLDGRVKIMNASVENYAWVTRDEIRSFFPQEMHALTDAMLVA